MNKIKYLLGLSILLILVSCILVLADTGNTGARLTLINTLPTISPTHTINDTTPQTNDSILCSTGTYYDINGDLKSDQEWRWSDGVSLIAGQTSQTLSLEVAGLDKGDTLICQSRVSDSYDWSLWINSSNSATIINSPPTASSIVFNPSPVNSSVNVECQWTYSDLDSDAQSTSNITWYVDDVAVQTETYTGSWPHLDASYYIRGEEVICSVKAIDNDSGIATSYVNGSITISNTRPTNLGINFFTNPSQKLDELTCQVSSRADADGDSMTNYYQFLDSDNVTVLQDWSISGTFDCNASTSCNKSDNIMCKTKVYDSLANSTTLNSTILIINTPPEAKRVNITPTSPGLFFDLDCNYEYYDIDGDAESAVYYSWYRNNTLTTNTSSTLSSVFTGNNDSWKCGVIVNDSFSNSSQFNSSTVVIGSSSPSVITFTDSGEVNEGSSITYTWTWSDPQLPLGGPYHHYVCNSSNITVDGCGDTEYCHIIDDTSSSTCSFNTNGDYGYIQYAYIMILDEVNSSSPIESDSFKVNHAPIFEKSNINVSYSGATNNYICHASNFSDPDAGDTPYAVYAFFAKNGSILQSFSGTNSYSTSSGAGTNIDAINCSAKAYDGLAYSTPLNTSNYYKIESLTYSSVRKINQVMSIYISPDNTSSETFVNISIKNPYNTIFSDLVATYDPTLDLWKYTFSPNIVGDWYVNSIKTKQSDDQSYSFLGSNNTFTVTAVSTTIVTGGGGGGSVTKIQEIPARGNVSGFCGDGFCGEGETPANCWDDCRVNYDTIFTCIWDDDIECNWSQNWFPATLISLLIIILVISIIAYQQKNGKK